MRFYHKLAQHYLTLHFREVVAASEKKNNEYWGVSQLLRGKELSDKKQEKGNEAILKLHDLTLEVLEEEFDTLNYAETLDDLTKLNFNKIIDEYNEAITAIIESASVDNKGASVNAVRDAKEIARQVQDLCKEFELWNVNFSDSDPVSIFQYQMMLYVCSKINSTDTFSDKKVDITKSMLNRMKEYKKNTANFQTKVRHVKEEITALQTSNELLCAKNPKGLDIPVNLTIMTFNLNPRITPSLGTLDELLKQAIKYIDAIRIDEPVYFQKQELSSAVQTTLFSAPIPEEKGKEEAPKSGNSTANSRSRFVVN